ncbi:MAG: cupredoxin domain-containing protein [Candidatus Liptonbacteria bacterium]|nr:cupredoxin domain-containing protein [Candidatus Liptonbacteria bacterium]
MDKKIIWAGLAVVAVLVAVILNYPGNSPVPQNSAPMNEESQKTIDQGLPADSKTVNRKEFTIASQNFSFAPSSLTVKKGDEVTIILKNIGGFHDLKIDEFGVATKKLNGEQEDRVTFIADKAGSFEYYCSVGTHRAMGMIGTLIVQD